MRAALLGGTVDLRMFEARLRRGMSTRDDVRAWLGEPSTLGYGVDPEGERFAEWTYRRPANRQELRIRFDVRGTVSAWCWSAEADEI